MEAPRSTVRTLIPILVASSVRRCQLSGTLCRLTISLKFFADSNPPSVQISVSDTGIGSSLVEFQEPYFATLGLSDKGGGLLSITTTGIHDKEINHYRLNLKQTLASKTRLKRLPSTQKNVGTFSGTEVCFSTSEEEKFDELMSWVIHFVQKMLVLKDQNVAIELIVEHIDSQGSRQDHLLQQNDDNSLAMSSSCIERLVSGLENYVLKHGDVVEEECQMCAAEREQLKVGNGQASSRGNCRGTGQTVEVGIVIATMSSQPCCWRANSSVTQTAAGRNLIKKAVKNALDDLKAKHTGLFLSSHAVKVREYAPDLSRTIAGLIMSSNDLDFQGECASLLGLHSVGAGEEELVESCIRDKIVGVIEMNDRKMKGERGNAPAPFLFECESLCEEECIDEDYEAAEEDTGILDF